MVELKRNGQSPVQTQRMTSHDSNPAATTSRAGDGSPRRFNMPDNVRNIIVACLAEFVGTFMFLFFAFAGTQVANNISTVPAPDIYDPSVLILISLSFGFSLMANVWAFYRVSGGLFNPAVSYRFHTENADARLNTCRSPSHCTLSEV
jgi:aquaporin related protein